MLSTLLALALLGTNAAFAADLPSTCGTNGDELCVDGDEDGNYANATENEDCLDTNARVGHGFRIVIGDGADNDCNGTDDDAEREEAVAAAREVAAKKADPKDSASPKATAAADAIEESFSAELDRCLTGGGFVNGDAAGVWGWDKASSKMPTCIEMGDGIQYERGRKGVGYTTPADRRAQATATSASKKADAAIVAVGHPAVPASEGVEAVPATGLYAELAEVEAAMATANAETKAQLAAQKADLERQIGELNSSIVALKGRVGAVERRLDTAEADINGLYGSAPIYRVSVAGLLYGGRSLYEYEGGPEVRSSVGGGAAVIVTTGYGWGGHALTLDLGFTQGGQGSGDASLPLSLGFAAVGHQWVVGDLAIGPEGILYASAMGNPLEPTVSSWGLGGGARGAYFFALPDPQTYLGIEARVDVTADSFGTNSIFDKGPGVIGTIGLTIGRGPER